MFKFQNFLLSTQGIKKRLKHENYFKHKLLFHLVQRKQYLTISRSTCQGYQHNYWPLWNWYLLKYAIKQCMELFRTCQLHGLVIIRISVPTHSYLDRTALIGCVCATNAIMLVTQLTINIAVQKYYEALFCFVIQLQTKIHFG